MKITNLIVNNLHGCYDYNVDFNEDVTFLYGTNGCGKTTILNITAALITGAAYKLFQYKFDKLELTYKSSKKDDSIFKICITYFQEDELDIVFNELRDRIALIRDIENRHNDNAYFERYEILRHIRDVFNYVYLPLNRSSSVFASEINEEVYYKRRIRLLGEIDKNDRLYQTDRSMSFVESLIMNKYHNITARINSINDNFRNDIFRSFLSEFRNIDFFDVIKEIKKDKISDIYDTKINFIKMIKEIDLWSDEHEEQIDKFFAEIINAHNSYTERHDEEKGISTSLVFGYTKILQIKEILISANKMEENKNKAMKPIDIFLNTINEFIQFSDDNKKIVITKEGRIFFTTKYSRKPISIYNLSSGEKQLVTFFAYLLFGVNPNKTGIFIVDEPELSLHLSWQKIFVEKILNINNSVQLIFATHSPEIINIYRDKMFKLVKETRNMEI